jgi:hypothetical protein
MMASGGGMMAPQPGGMPMRSMIMPIPMGVGYGFGAPMMFMGGGGGIIRIAFVAVLVLFFIDSIKNLFGGESGVQLGGDRIAVIKIQIGLLAGTGVADARALSSNPALYRHQREVARFVSFLSLHHRIPPRVCFECLHHAHCHAALR